MYRYGALFIYFHYTIYSIVTKENTCTYFFRWNIIVCITRCVRWDCLPKLIDSEHLYNCLFVLFRPIGESFLKENLKNKTLCTELSFKTLSEERGNKKFIKGDHIFILIHILLRWINHVIYMPTTTLNNFFDFLQTLSLNLAICWWLTDLIPMYSLYRATLRILTFSNNENVVICN